MTEEEFSIMLMKALKKLNDNVYVEQKNKLKE